MSIRPSLALPSAVGAALLAVAGAAACGTSSHNTSPKGTLPTGVDDTQIALEQASADLSAATSTPPAPSASDDGFASIGAPNLCDERFPNDRVITPDGDSASRRAPTADDAVREKLACYVAMRDVRSSWCCKR